jgi:hypothetical protein
MVWSVSWSMNGRSNCRGRGREMVVARVEEAEESGEVVLCKGCPIAWMKGDGHSSLDTVLD